MCDLNIQTYSEVLYQGMSGEIHLVIFFFIFRIVPKIDLGNKTHLLNLNLTKLMFE